MWEETTLRVTVADRPCGGFYEFYSISPEYFGYRLVFSHFVHFTVEFNELLLSLLITSSTDIQETLDTAHKAYIAYYALCCCQSCVVIVMFR
jgi:hypothetical protein